MSIAALIRSMAAAGATPEAIAIAVEAIEAVSAADADRRAAQAQRKQRQRDRARDIHGTVTGQSRDIPLPLGSLSPEPPITPNPNPSKNPPKGGQKGSRLSPDWQPSQADREAASSEGMPSAEIDREGRKFRDYWTAKPGKDGVKLDWPATWRNWVRRACEARGWTPQAEPEARAGPSQVYISPETDPEAWDAWRRYRQGKSLPRDAKGGWPVTSKFPPHTESIQ